MENIRKIALILGVDEKFIKETQDQEKTIYEISGDIAKKLEIQKSLTTDLLENFNLKFVNCVFIGEILGDIQPPIEDEYTNFCNYISFEDCDFREKVDCFSMKFKDEIIFSGVIFEKEVNFSDIIFEKEVNFSDIIFEKEADFFKVAFKDQLDFSLYNFEDKVNFNEVTFEKEVNFSGIIFEKEADFFKVAFKDQLDFSLCNFEDKVNFNEVTFEKEVNFSGATFENKADFSGATFKKEVNFSGATFENKADFSLCNFEYKVNFNEANFKEKADFKNSCFEYYADFCGCEFEKTANFYEVIFKKTPNFSQTIFKGDLNLVNIKLNFDFKDLKEKIQEEYNNKEKPLENIANDFRDSFRIFKSALIKDNNLLDASNFHRVELYCKEIELKAIWNKRGSEEINEKEIQKNECSFSKLIDSLLLGFYRKLSDHHTDFLKVFNNLILLISLYVVFFIGLSKLYEDKLKDNRCKLTLFHFFDTYESWIAYGVYFILMFGCLWIFIKSPPLPKIFIEGIFKKICEAFSILKRDFCEFFKSILIALFFVSCFTGLFFILYELSNLVLYEFFILDKDVVYSIFINVLFISLYLSLVYTKSLFFGRYILLIISYVWFIVIMIQYPSIVYPLIFNSINKTFDYLPLTTLVIVYTILLGLVLFSLQKTARKNSIVPS